MKLLNREPTEEMIRIAEGHDCGAYRFFSTIAIFQAMYDAAPEIKVDIDPVGYWSDARHHAEIAEQVAKLQHKANQAVLDAANTALSERNALKAENERLGNGWHSANVATFEAQSERDELISALKPILVISDRKHDAWDHAHALIAKYEGDSCLKMSA